MIPRQALLRAVADSGRSSNPDFTRRSEDVVCCHKEHGIRPKDFEFQFRVFNPSSSRCCDKACSCLQVAIGRLVLTASSLIYVRLATIVVNIQVLHVSNYCVSMAAQVHESRNCFSAHLLVLEKEDSL